MATDPTPEPEATAAGGPPAMTPHAIAVCSSLSTATRACPGVDGHAEPDTLASARSQ